MRTFLDAKAMAKSLRTSLGQKQITLSNSDCLEIVAAQFAFEDWNTLSAKIEDTSSAADGKLVAAHGVQLLQATPILRIFSVEKAKEFYLGFLGFSIDWEQRYGDDFPLYAQISRSQVTLHLSEHHGDASPGSTVFIRTRGIAEYHRELIAKNYRYNKPAIQDAPWNARVLEVSDPFGNRLRFSEPNSPEATPA